MWNEGSHSSDEYWFRAKLEWGKGGKDNDFLGRGEFIKPFIYNVCNLFNLSRRKSVVVRDLNMDNYFCVLAVIKTTKPI